MKSKRDLGIKILKLMDLLNGKIYYDLTIIEQAAVDILIAAGHAKLVLDVVVVTYKAS